MRLRQIWIRVGAVNGSGIRRMRLRQIWIRVGAVAPKPRSRHVDATTGVTMRVLFGITLALSSVMSRIAVHFARAARLWRLLYQHLAAWFGSELNPTRCILMECAVALVTLLAAKRSLSCHDAPA